MNIALRAGCLSACLLLFAAQPASAGLVCSGTISYLGVGRAGSLTVALAGSSPVAINSVCSLTSQGPNHTDVATCKAAYAMLLTSQARGAPVRLYYEDSSLTNCNQIAAWSSQPSFYWVDLVL